MVSAFSGSRFRLPLVVTSVGPLAPVRGLRTLAVAVAVAVNTSARLPARMSRERVPRTRISSVTSQAAPTFQVVTVPEVE